MRRVLIANRGEIACRVIRSCKALGIETVAVHSEADAGSLHTVLADRAVAIGPAKAADSYLRMERVLDAAIEAGADAIHPGYGFLAENAGFARAVMEAGLTWVGPDPRTIEDMGDKERARLLAHGAGVPILQGSARFLEGQLDGLEDAGAAVGYPLLVKAAAGGGGIGMRKVERPEQLREVVGSTQTMARNAFGDGCVYLERYLHPARHIEIQVFGFGDGRAIHVYERECSIQRRFQKIVEESPAPRLSAATRNRMAEAAVALARQERYRGAGTIEFVVGPDEDFYFLEMNTRIQVEHPVSEMLTGLDLVGMQLRLARGDRDLADQYPQAAVTATGHALECRLYAERPEMNFLPSPGPLTVFRLPPEGQGLRVDTGYREGDKVTHYYDPMLAKLVVHAADRTAALDRMAAVLDTVHVEGIRTNAAFLGKLMRHPRFRAGESWTGFVESYLSDLK